MTETLPDRLRNWVDSDVAAYWLAISLGLMKAEPGLFQTRARHVFWSANPVGEILNATLDQMVAAGILERREEPDVQYRWDASFRRSWETAG